jgi:hypothetical protein
LHGKCRDSQPAHKGRATLSSSGSGMPPAAFLKRGRCCGQQHRKGPPGHNGKSGRNGDSTQEVIDVRPLTPSGCLLPPFHQARAGEEQENAQQQDGPGRNRISRKPACGFNGHDVSFACLVLFEVV